MVASDYTQGYGSFNFLPIVDATLSYAEGCRNTPYWADNLTFFLNPKGYGKPALKLTKEPQPEKAKTRATSGPEAGTANASPVSQDIRLKSLSPSPFLQLPTEVITAVLQPLVNRLRSRPSGGVILPAYLPVPDDMGIQFVVFAPRQEQEGLYAFSKTTSEKRIDVVIDPQVSSICGYHQNRNKIPLNYKQLAGVSRLYTSNYATPLPPPLAHECDCREPEDYQDLTNLSRVGNHRLTAILGEMVWQNACVTFECPESFLLFVRDRPSAMKHIQGINIAIDLDKCAFYGWKEPYDFDHIFKAWEKNQDSMPVIEMLKYLADITSNSTGTEEREHTGSESRSPTSTRAVLRFVNVLLHPGRIYARTPSPLFASLFRVRPTSNPFQGEKETKRLIAVEKVSGIWAPLFRAIEVKDSFQVYVFRQEYDLRLKQFSDKLKQLWGPDSLRSSEKVQFGPENTDMARYLREREESLKPRQSLEESEAES